MTDEITIRDWPWLVREWIQDFGYSFGAKCPQPIKRVIWWTLCGMPRCYSMAPWGTNFCKRRTGHWGKCHNSGGFYKWDRPQSTGDHGK